MFAGVAGLFYIGHHIARWRKYRSLDGGGLGPGCGVTGQDRELEAQAEILQDKKKQTRQLTVRLALVVMEMMVVREERRSRESW